VVKKYTIRINCGCFQDIEVEAENSKEAIEQAKIEFSCMGDSPEFAEIINAEK